jgi:hypothetical protein
MSDLNSRRDKLAFFSETPDIGELRTELQRSLYNGGNVARLNSNDDIRLARWDGQTDDGKKHSGNLREGEQAFPFEGASDVRCRLVDQTINELVVLLVSSWQLARIRVSGTEVGDASRAASIQTLAEWVVNNKLRADLLTEAELLGQYTQQFGWSVAHIGWERRLGLRNVVITLAELEQRAAGGDIIAYEAVNSLKSTGTSDYTISALTTLLGCDNDNAKRIADELMVSGTSTYNQEYAVSNAPVVAALKPYDEICFPPETLDLQDARVIFRRTFMTEVELREMIKTSGWNEEFVNQAVETAGQSDWYSEPNIIPSTTNIGNSLERADHLIEIVYAYNRQIGPNGVPCIYYTVFCPNTRDDLNAKHEMLDYAHGMYPFVEYRRERLRRSIVECRGVPELAYTDQLEVKAQRDSIRDRTAFETLPPIKVKKRLGTQNVIQPGGLLPVTTPDDYTFLSPPSGNPALAFNLIDRVEQTNAAYFGLYHPNIPPVKTQTTQQFIVNNWLSAWSRIYKQVMSLTLQYMDGAEIERVVGMPIVLQPQELSAMYDFNVAYNVRELDTDYVLEKLKAISTFVVPMDAGGVIDRNKLTARFVEAISPEAAKDIVLDQASASQRMYADVQTDIAKMMAGMEPQYVENDPAAQSKLQFVQDILQKNPKAQQAAQADQQFQMLFQNYVKNLQMSVQQQQNKSIGRIGVTPVSDRMMQQGEQPPAF